MAGTSDEMSGIIVTMDWAVTSPTGGSGAAVKGSESPCVVVVVLGCGDEASGEGVRSESVMTSS